MSKQISRNVIYKILKFAVNSNNLYLVIYSMYLFLKYCNKYHDHTLQYSVLNVILISFIVTFKVTLIFYLKKDRYNGNLWFYLLYSKHTRQKKFVNVIESDQ